MKLFSLCIAGLSFAALAASSWAAGASADPATLSASIPARPEALKFPPLNYEPPVPEEYRVALKSGPVAYIAPYRELPLVNIVFLVRTGEYV